MKLILASTSKQRCDLLKKEGFVFSVRASRYKENLALRKTPKELVQFLALQKARVVARRVSKGVVIGADTVVVQGTVMGKPRSVADAIRILRKLSGRTHSVVTGIALVDAETGHSRTAVDETRVTFKKLSLTQIDEYVKSKEPFGAAGAYRIQMSGKRFVARIRGNVDTIIGLPITLLKKELKKFSVASMSRKR